MAGRSTVVFAGAGASAASGYLQSGEILPEVLRRLDAGRFEHPGLSGEEPGLLERARALLPGLAADFRDVEFADLVSILDHCLAEGEALGPGLEPEALRHMRRLLDVAMAEVLSAPLPGAPAPVAPATFARALLDRAAGEGDGPLTILSTNYDVSLDVALFRELEARGLDPREAVDLGFVRRDPAGGGLVPPPRLPALRLLKLHGALNWLRCMRCGTVSVDFHGPVTHRASEGDARGTCTCGHSPLEMLLVAPSLVRDVRDVNLRSIWQAALEALRVATTWVFIGFSLRGEDLAIRSMLARARLASQDVSRRMLVVGKGDEPPAGLGLFLGEFEYLGGGLERLLASGFPAR